MALQTAASSPYSLDVLSDAVGSAPEVTDNLEVENRAINSVNQAFSVCENMRQDWIDGIEHAARITAKLNGERPYNQKKLKNAGKDWKANISTGFLSTECSRVLPRLYMPIKTAKYLTAASLPPGWVGGEEKTAYFRQAITETLRSWPKFNFWIRGLAREVGIWGFGFNAWMDEWDWRPTLLRMDKGFVPQGTEVMEFEPPFFMAKIDYKPWELLEILKKADKSGRKDWVKENVTAAINAAMPPSAQNTEYETRSYEDLIRQAAWQYNYTKGTKMVETWHLFAKEADGKVSHYILLSNQTGNPNYTASDMAGSDKVDNRLLYENLDRFDSMVDVVNTMVFDYGDGTVHGSWGAGQILYDLSVQVEKVRCDSIDNMRMTNKIKAQVPEAKNVNDVKLVVNDTMQILSGATWAGNQAAITQDINGYELLDAKLTKIAQEKIGAFVPPIPLQPSDIKAAQVNAAMAKERELQEALLENWLIQFAVVVGTMTKRLLKKGTPDKTGKALRELLLQKLTEDELDILTKQFPVQSVADFTEYAASRRAAFCQSIMGNSLFRQNVAARVMAEGVGDVRFVEELVKPDGDQQDEIAAQREQILENSAMLSGQNVPILATDNDWVHMQTMKPGLLQQLQQGNLQISQIGLQHYAAHWSQGVDKKTLPKDQINPEKSFISQAEKHIEELQKAEQIKQQTAQAQQQAEQQAQMIVQAQQGMIPQ